MSQHDAGTLCFYGLMDLEMPVFAPRVAMRVGGDSEAVGSGKNNSQVICTDNLEAEEARWF